jgi:hypothetical protein
MHLQVDVHVLDCCLLNNVQILQFNRKYIKYTCQQIWIPIKYLSFNNSSKSYLLTGNWNRIIAEFIYHCSLYFPVSKLLPSHDQ